LSERDSFISEPKKKKRKKNRSSREKKKCTTRTTGVRRILHVKHKKTTKTIQRKRKKKGKNIWSDRNSFIKILVPKKPKYLEKKAALIQVHIPGQRDLKNEDNRNSTQKKPPPKPESPLHRHKSRHKKAPILAHGD